MSSRRARGRGNSRGGRQQNIRNQQMDSNGPGGRIRGTPQQVLDRYLALARDASSAGDSVLAENLFQHAEHYTRMLNAAMPPQQQNQQHQGNGRDDQSMDDADGNTDGDSNQPDQGGNEQRDRQQQGRQRRSADANNQPGEAKGEPGDQPAAPAAPPEWSAGDPQPDGDQPASPPRRRRRSRFQRQQEQDGGDSGAPQSTDASDHGAPEKGATEKGAPEKSASGNGVSDNGATDHSADSNPVPPIDLSAAAPEAASKTGKSREPGEQPLV